MIKLKTLRWGDGIGLSESAHLLKTGESFLAVVRGNMTMVGRSERFHVKKITPTIAGFEDGGTGMSQGMWVGSRSWKTQENRFS